MSRQTFLQVAADKLLRQAEATPGFNFAAQLDKWIEQIDQRICAQLDEILHHPDFQQLESAWRGLNYLVMQTECSPLLYVRVISCSKVELCHDLMSGREFDLTATFHKVYEEEYGVFGGLPYGVLIGDYEFTPQADDIALLRSVSGVGTAAHAPFIAGASASFFGAESYAELPRIRETEQWFKRPEFAHWREFRESEDSRYVGLCLPRILLRLPYGEHTRPADGFQYRERVEGLNQKKHLWGNAAYALGVCITRAFAKYGWLAAMEGWEGGRVEGLPACSFPATSREGPARRVLELAVDDKEDKLLSDEGFIPLMQGYGIDVAMFTAVKSCQRPKRYNTNEANRSARLCCDLPFLMCISRFTQAIKCIGRDKIGSFMDRRSCEQWLNAWIGTYKHPNPAIADLAGLARMPLSDAYIDVEEFSGAPGIYFAAAYLMAHYQLPGPYQPAMRFVARLPGPRH